MLVLVISIVSVSSLHFVSIKRVQKSSITTMKANNNNIRLTITGGAMLLSVLFSPLIGSSYCLADDVTDLAPVAPVAISEKKQLTEEQRVQRKLDLQKKARTSSGSTTENTGSYLDSLAREKAKQNDRVKTKTQRRQDLCEMLGRGC